MNDKLWYQILAFVYFGSLVTVFVGTPSSPISDLNLSPFSPYRGDGAKGDTRSHSTSEVLRTVRHEYEGKEIPSLTVLLDGANENIENSRTAGYYNEGEFQKLDVKTVIVEGKELGKNTRESRQTDFGIQGAGTGASSTPSAPQGLTAAARK